VIPHGYVVPPACAQSSPATGRTAVCHLLFGSLRANRDLATVLYNWRFGSRQQDTNLRLLLRAPGPVTLAEERDRWDLLAAMATASRRPHVEVLPFPGDADVIRAAATCDTVLLPYRWGSHSGQLELAFDLGLVPVTSSVGYLREQRELHGDLVPEPAWFDWSDGSTYAYGERFLAALDQSLELVSERRETRRASEFAEYRRAEHEHVLAAYREVYDSR
jgi:hypothetical protein